MPRVSSTSVLDHTKERALLFLSIDDEGTAKDLVSAVLTIDLREAEELTIGQRAS